MVLRVVGVTRRSEETSCGLRLWTSSGTPNASHAQYGRGEGGRGGEYGREGGREGEYGREGGGESMGGREGEYGREGGRVWEGGREVMFIVMQRKYM